MSKQRCAICINPAEQGHHIARPTGAVLALCRRCNRKQENYEQHSGAFDRGSTPIGKMIEQLCSLSAEIDPVLAQTLVAMRSVLALASGERIGPRPISNRTAIRDDTPRREPEMLMRSFLGAMAQSIEELGLPEQAKLARAASTARPSELFAEQARELIVLTPQAVKVLADAQAGEREPDVALFKEFFDRTRSLLLEVCSP